MATVGAAILHVLHGCGGLVAGFLGGAGWIVVGAKAMLPAILLWLLWSASLLAACLLVASLMVVLALLTTSAFSAAVVASAVVAISVLSAVLLYFRLEV